MLQSGLRRQHTRRRQRTALPPCHDKPALLARPPDNMPPAGSTLCCAPPPTFLAREANLRVLCVSSAWVVAGVMVHTTAIFAPVPARDARERRPG